MAMKKEHPDFYLRLAKLTVALNEGLRKTHRYAAFAEIGECGRLDIIIGGIEKNLKAASEALAIIKKGE